MRLNVKAVTPAIYTHEGAVARKITPRQQLERLVMASLLWEDSFYVDGQTTAQFIQEILPKVKPQDIADIAIKARKQQHLRHMPLLLVRELARLKSVPAGLVADTLTQVIDRADEIAEFVAIYRKDNPKEPLSKQVKKGLAAAFNKFDGFQLAKYDRDGAYRLRDVAFLVHPVPADKEQAKVFARLLNKTEYPSSTKGGFKVKSKLRLGKFQPLAAADTWENRLSASEDGVKKTAEEKKTEWTGLLQDRKLGAMALLRNLRNMTEAGVDENLIREALVHVNPERVLPFRFISAAKYAPKFEDVLEDAMFKCLAGVPKLKGKTTLIVDNSISMNAKVSGRSEITRREAAAGLAMLLREICEQVEVISFSTRPATVPPRRGFALREAIANATPQSSTNTGFALELANKNSYDRVIIITDEQSQQKIGGPQGLGYVINVAYEQNGIGYGAWNHIDGWSEAVVDYIQALEGQG